MITFDKETHTYIADGVIIPSVTQIIRSVRGDDYTNIPSHILEAKADYGNRIHEWIEMYATTGWEMEQTRTMKMSTDQYKQWDGIEITSVEQTVHYKDMYAGTYDMKGFYKGKPALFDIKTTQVLDEDYLSWQLSMYRFALDAELDLYVIWLPKANKGALRPIPQKDDEEIIKLLKTYQEGYDEELPF